MRRLITRKELKDLAEMRAMREAKQPYATEIEDREAEKHHHERMGVQRDPHHGRRRHFAINASPQVIPAPRFFVPVRTHQYAAEPRTAGA